MRLTWLLAISSFGTRGSSASVVQSPTFAPNEDSARDNAFRLFNAVHSAGRQWGSSYYHNGFSFIPAVMPKGTLMYHGGYQREPPPGPEWLAFEIEHAENFAHSRKRSDGRPTPDDLTKEAQRDEQRPLRLDDDGGDRIMRGYLHTYRMNRDINLLYVDGMSAAKGRYGTLDSQDLVLMENKTGLGDGFMGEVPRVQGICEQVVHWGFDGYVRMEIGFEVIYCDFSVGLDQISSKRTYLLEDKLGPHMDEVFYWARAVGERYDGIGGGRLQLDFSSMVSGFFFPINVSSTNPARPDLVRLGATSLDKLKSIKTYLIDIVKQPRRFTVNWQHTTDMIVSRHSDSLAMMASENVTWTRFIDDLERSTLLYVDAPALPDDMTANESTGNETEEAIALCTKHYLLPPAFSKHNWAFEDRLISTSLERVAGRVCSRLLEARSILLQASSASGPNRHRISRRLDNDELERAFASTKEMIRDLVDELGWTTWKKIRPCPLDEVPFIAMWPFGDKEDHWEPKCQPFEALRPPRLGYWDNPFK